MNVSFDEITIQKLFGHEAAEDENPARLHEYYFKSNIYEQITVDLPLRILVGHKGTGKSALFKTAIMDYRQPGHVAVMIQPNDIVELLTTSPDNFIHSIMLWKEGITRIVTRKVLDELGVSKNPEINSLEVVNNNIVGFLESLISSLKPNEHQPGAEDKLLAFLERPQITVYMDDLDRGWQGRRQDTQNISALLNAVRDLTNDNRDVFFKVALRSDVYYLVRTSDESTDKIESSVIWLTWTNHEIFVLLVKRIETFFGRSVDEQQLLGTSQRELSSRYLEQIMESQFTGRGHWEKAPIYQVLMSLIRKRPRDLVKLCTLAARQAANDQANIIHTEHLKAVFTEYSQGRIQDTINEFRFELPDIERLVMNMKPNKRERTTKQGYVYTTSALLEKINNIRESNRFRLANDKIPDSQDLAAFLYKINFLTARKETESGIVRRYFEENRYLSARFYDFGFDWEVHPAYRWALQPDSIDDIYDSLELSVEEDE